MWTRCATCWQSSCGWAALIASLLSVGCGDGSYRLGGAVPGDHTEVRSVRTDLCADGAGLEFIDRMEDEDASIEFTSGRSGSWFAFNDLSSAQFPGMNLKGPFPMAALEPPRGDSHFAAHTYGADFSGWGAGIGFEVRSQAFYDASAYGGISFWARRSPESVPTIRFNVPDKHTAALGKECTGPNGCDDNFGYDVDLDTSFQYYRFTWADLSQAGFSNRILPSIDVTKIIGLRFQASTSDSFDFWIDDIAFVCRGK